MRGRRCRRFDEQEGRGLVGGPSIVSWRAEHLRRLCRRCPSQEGPDIGITSMTERTAADPADPVEPQRRTLFAGDPCMLLRARRTDCVRWPGRSWAIFDVACLGTPGIRRPHKPPRSMRAPTAACAGPTVTVLG